RAQGNIAEALRTFDDLRVLLREDLGTFPSAELNELHDQLLNAHESDRGGETPVAAADVAKTVKPPVAIGERIDPRLREIKLVGRENILASLKTELDLAVAGELRIALLAGEGGVGKTRLAAELASSRDDITVLYGRCEPDEVRPFRIWSGLLRTAMSQIDDSARESVVGGDGPILSRILPELVKNLGVVPGPPADLESERQALFGAVLRVIGRLTTIKPMLIILDDLHWADRSTLLLLGSLAGDDPPKGVLALGIYRDNELPDESPLLDTVANLQRHLPALRLKVDSLDTDAVRSLIRERIDENLAPALHDQTGGNPFFIEQIVRHLEETGEEDPGSAPAEAREIISQRATRLPPGGPELLSRASLIGHDFDLDVLLATTSEDEDRTIELLDAAVKAGLLDESPNIPGRYSFVHALLRSTLGQGLSLTRRSRIHRDIGEAIEHRTQGRGSGRFSELAWHFSQAGPEESDRAVLYATRAAEQAEGRLAYVEAVGFYEDAIRACRSDHPVDATVLAQLLISLAEAQWRMGALQKAGDTFFEAAEAARQSGVPDLLARAAIGTCWGSWESFDADREAQAVLLREALAQIDDDDSPSRAKCMGYLAHILYFSGGSSREAIRLATESHAMALRLDDPHTEFTVLTATQFFMVERVNSDKRIASANRCVEIAESSKDPEDLAESLAWRSVAMMSKGRFEEAEADQARHAVLNRTLPQITVAAAAMKAVRCFIEGRWDEGEALTEQFLATDIPNSARIAMEDALQYMVKAQQGKLGPYTDHIATKAAVASEWDTWPAWQVGLQIARFQDGKEEEARRALDDIGYLEINEVTQMDILYLVYCGISTLLAGQMQDRQWAVKLTAMMEDHAGEWSIFGPAGSTFGPVDMMLGEMYLLQDLDREAATSFERAVKSCERMHARPLLARSRLGLAEALNRIGNPEGPERTKKLRQSGLEIAHDLGMSPILNRYQ
ncbi:MAG: AAA family ATPase, partial [Solirubrobacterales bacterium]